MKSNTITSLAEITHLLARVDAYLFLAKRELRFLREGPSVSSLVTRLVNQLPEQINAIDVILRKTSTSTSGHIQGHQPHVFSGQCGAILAVLMGRREQWVPAYELAARAMQYSASIQELRDAGYVIELRTQRVDRQVHGSFRLMACPGEEVAQPAVEEPRPPGGAANTERSTG